MFFMYLFFILLVIAISVAAGARDHNQVNARLAKLIGKNADLPPDFRIWMLQHKGEYDSIGKAMGAWADARFGGKYDELLK